jgi:hyaluronan synthase
VIPEVSLRRVRPYLFGIVVLAVSTAGFLRHTDFFLIYNHYQVLMITWALVFAVSLLQWGISLFERPFKGASRYLESLNVVVCIPVYNEDPATLDRVLAALAGQTRLPDSVHVVDDGSKVSYSEIRGFWESHPVIGPRLRWTRQANGGKKHAQAACFGTHPYADIFVTADSDTTLAGNAIEEGLKPFRHQDVYSVAGLELAWNHSRNLLTLMTSARTLSWQLLSCAAQNVAGGDVTVNRGTYALYRADMIRETLTSYLDETFLGHAVKLGDDAALTLFAQIRGRAVQQPSAVCYTMYPEQLKHHFKQWIRWMRGSTIRTCWRVRYLPLTSWSLWFTLINTWSFVMSIAATVAAAICWPQSEDYTAAAVLATIVWAILMALRTTTVRRTDQTWLDRFIVIVMSPFAAFWVMVVLRPLRIYGIFTFLRQGWVTRGQVEIIEDGRGGQPPGLVRSMS